MEPIVVKGAGPADLIAFCWYELGYQPQDSLVVIAMHGPRQRLGMIARIDLPVQHTRRSVMAEMVGSITRPLVASGASAAMALICSDDALRRPEPVIVPVLLREFRRAGLDLPDVLGVSSSAFRSLLCDEVTCCPAQGHPIHEVQSSATAAAQVLHGRSIARGEADLIADVAPAQAVRPDVGEGDDLGEWADVGEWDDVEEAADLEGAAGERLRWWHWWQRALAAEEAQVLQDGPQDGAEDGSREDPRLRILWWVLRDVMLRDALLLHAMDAADSDCEALVREPQGEDAWGRWGELVMEVGTRPLSHDRLEASTRLLARCARHVPHSRPGSRAPVLAMLAWLAWFQGNGIRARLLVQQVFDDDPEYSLAHLVEEFLLAGVPPPWSARRAARHGGNGVQSPTRVNGRASTG